MKEVFWFTNLEGCGVSSTPPKSQVIELCSTATALAAEAPRRVWCVRVRLLKSGKLVVLLMGISALAFIW